jgi:hypothetical protein
MIGRIVKKGIHPISVATAPVFRSFHGSYSVSAFFAGYRERGRIWQYFGKPLVFPAFLSWNRHLFHTFTLYRGLPAIKDPADSRKIRGRRNGRLLFLSWTDHVLRRY